ncbi:MAG: hypothetical protein AAGA56_06195 [Myxococcota bacterium]
MANWREELLEVVKSQAERDAEEAARKRQRLEAALAVAGEAWSKARDALAFAAGKLEEKKQPGRFDEKADAMRLDLHEQSIVVSLSREDAVLGVTFNEGRPRDFDFAKDRHLSPKDVEEYVGRRTVELARAAQKSSPW